MYEEKEIVVRTVDLCNNQLDRIGWSILMSDIFNRISDNTTIFCIVVSVVAVIFILFALIGIRVVKDKGKEAKDRFYKTIEIVGIILLVALGVYAVAGKSWLSNKVDMIPIVLKKEYNLDDAQFIDNLNLESMTKDNSEFRFTAKSDGKLRIYILQYKDGVVNIFADNGELLK